MAALWTYLEFQFFRILLSSAARAGRSRLLDGSPEFERVLRENLALKAQVIALRNELHRTQGKRPRVKNSTRAAQVLAHLMTRGNTSFQKYYLTASSKTIRSWLTLFKTGPKKTRQNKGGRPRLFAEVTKSILRMKRENPGWGTRRIQQQLRQLGIAVARRTIQRMLQKNGMDPRGAEDMNWSRFRSTAQDMAWGLDFFIVRTRSSVSMVLLIIDLYTRELIDLRAHDTRRVNSAWTVRVLAEAMHRTSRTPQSVVHDRGAQFFGMFLKQTSVMEIQQRWTPPALPIINCIAERAIKSVRFELTNHLRPANNAKLQELLDLYRENYLQQRPHQSLDGRTPHQHANGASLTPLIDLKSFRDSQIRRKGLINGLLSEYWIESAEERQAA